MAEVFLEQAKEGTELAAEAQPNALTFVKRLLAGTNSCTKEDKNDGSTKEEDMTDKDKNDVVKHRRRVFSWIEAMLTSASIDVSATRRALIGSRARTHLYERALTNVNDCITKDLEEQKAARLRYKKRKERTHQ